MCYGMNLQKLALVVFGSILVSAPALAVHLQQSDSDQTKSDQAKSEQAKQNSSQPNAAPAANSASTNGPAQIVVPAGTHLPLVVHSGITSRNAQPGQPVYMETTFPVVVNDRIVIPVGSYVSGGNHRGKAGAKRERWR